MEDNFQNPASSGKMPHEMKKVRKPHAEIIVDRMEKPEKVKIQDLNIAWKVVYQLHLRSMIPRKVEKRHCNCGVKLEPSDEARNDHLVVKFFGTSTFMVKGESHSKYGPRYVHFQRDCLKEYTYRKHDLSYEDFPFTEIKVDQKTLKALSNDYNSNLKEYGLNIDL